MATDDIAARLDRVVAELSGAVQQDAQDGPGDGESFALLYDALVKARTARDRYRSARRHVAA